MVQYNTSLRKHRDMKAFIWDLDRTLLDSYETIVSAAKRAADDAGLNDPEEAVLRAVKQGSVSAYLKDAGARSGERTG